MQRQGHTVLPLIMRRGTGMAQPEDVILAEQAVLLRDLPRGRRALFPPVRAPWRAGCALPCARSACRRFRSPIMASALPIGCGRSGSTMFTRISAAVAPRMPFWAHASPA